MKTINVTIQSDFGPNFEKEVAVMKDIIEAVSSRFSVHSHLLEIMAFSRSQDNDPVTDHFDNNDYVAVVEIP